MLRKHQIFGLLMLVALLLAACQPIIAEPEAQPSDEDVAAAVDAVWDEYEASQMAGDPDRWIALWTDDGVKMAPDAPAIEGTDQIYARAQRSMAEPVDEMVITALETQSAGDMAYSRGVFSFTFTIDETGEQESMDGKFMTILQRQPDGSWKIHRDIHNWNAPPAAQATDEEVDVEAATEAIQAVWAEYSASALAGDPERRMALWAEDGIQMPPNKAANIGKETIGAGTEARMAGVITNEYAVTPEEIEVFGDTAYARGVYSANLTPVDGGDPIVADGKFMTILKRQEDGSWKIYRDIFNSNVP